MMEVIFDTSTLKKEQERELLTGFDEQVWRGLVDFLIVYKNAGIKKTFAATQAAALA